MRQPATPSARVPRRALTALLGALLLSASAGAAAAVPYVDQNCSVLPSGNFQAVWATGPSVAQTFTVGFAGTLTAVHVVVDPRGTPVQNLDLEVQATTGGVANGTVLATASVAPFGGVNPTVVFDVSAANLAVTPGQVLAFVLKSNATLGNDYLVRARNLNPYGGGQFTDSGGSFASGAGWDAIFKTWVEPASLPGAGNVDQSNLPAPTSNFTAILSGLTATQTFTVGVDGILTDIEVMIDPRNSPVLDLSLEVQATTGGVANGTVLAATSVPPFAGPNPMVNFDLRPYNLGVSSGEVLAFVLRSHAAGGTDYLCRTRNTNFYPAGELTTSNGSIVSGSGWDAIFETYVATTVGVGDVVAGGSGLELAPSAPNPVTRQATLTFALPRGGHARLAIYDLAGREVIALVDGALPAGTHRATWHRDGARAPAGVYFARLTAAGESRGRRLIVID
jgi:hypothetical protein